MISINLNVEEYEKVIRDGEFKVPSNSSDKLRIEYWLVKIGEPIKGKILTYNVRLKGIHEDKVLIETEDDAEFNIEVLNKADLDKMVEAVNTHGLLSEANRIGNNYYPPGYPYLDEHSNSREEDLRDEMRSEHNPLLDEDGDNNSSDDDELDFYEQYYFGFNRPRNTKNKKHKGKEQELCPTSKSK